MSLFLQRIWVQVSADRRKFGALCVMVGLGLLLWARIIVISNLPRTAIAEDPIAIPIPTDRTGGAILDLGIASDRPIIEIELFADVERDPFVINSRLFPREVGQDVPDPPQPGSNPSDDLIESFVERMRLDGVSHFGDSPRAMIDGKTFRIGERVPVAEGEVFVFRIQSIGDRTVTLECEGQTFELKMPAPRS